MVNLDDTVAGLVEQKSAAEKRSVSSYLALLAEKDLRAAGLIDGESAARAELNAIAEEIGLPAALDTLRRKLRTGKTAA